MAGNFLQGKVSLVTGASSGMGRATALLLAQHGSKIVCCDLRPEPNPKGYEADLDKTTVQVIEQNGGEAIFQQVDISNFPQVEAAFEQTVAKFGRLDIVVNCAGLWVPFRKFVDEDDELWSKMMAINLGGTSKVCRLALRQFLKQDVDPAWGSRGRIVNISSCSGVIAYGGQVAYCATKAAINHLTRAAAIDHAQDSINVNCIAPGVVETGMARGNIENKDIIKVMKAATPWPRLGKADDIAEAVLNFCTPASQWVTGQVLSVDGGMTLGVPA
ncbi:hypothetical protein A1O3_04527 [Capronia epimyces CBS 606.96]|uniref:3-oxoacyl-[acyl-carrier protein] reductase n=1 Tax=Capronia epimyces CBS 606.96 TaxID=1182542 RepID=W9Y424_9EURO|nr:uncharacterized protein A1O3_04527 [Capronia epimyces CBS 606.96]EXJ87567.1 hypothetical protein A1O3_04527 [Capronia epimyces CBS 606.96]